MPSSSCSPRTPTPTLPSRRSTTSASTTTCSSHGTHRLSGCTRSSTTCWATGSGAPARHRKRAGGRAPLVGADHEVKTFLARNHVPYRSLDVDRDDEAQRLQGLAHARVDDLPLVLVPDGEILRSPSTLDLAGALGLRTRAQQPLYDLCIVGGGPAGTAAAVYAASEGLRTVVVEREAPGGQAGQSASIENYLGFPKGLSGADLTHRAVAQAARFGAEMVLARDVVAFETRGPVQAVRFGDSEDLVVRGARTTCRSTSGSSSPGRTS